MTWNNHIIRHVQGRLSAASVVPSVCDAREAACATRHSPRALRVHGDPGDQGPAGDHRVPERLREGWEGKELGLPGICDWPGRPGSEGGEGGVHGEGGGPG